MAKFYYWTNNGVVGVVDEKTYHELESRKHFLAARDEKGLPRPQLPPIRPIFTFSDPRHPSFHLMSGSVELMQGLFKGHEVEEKNLWVPFSNGRERLPFYGLTKESARAVRWEMSFCTNLDEAMETFGLARSSASTG